MPTGYTAKLMESGQSFSEFAIGCARAFGATIMMRDDPHDKPIPEKFEASDYHAKALASARDELRRLEAMNSDERFAFSSARKSAAVMRSAEYLQREKEENGRIDAMMKDVIAWQPPTPEHSGMKSFMIEQLTISRNSLDWAEKEMREAVDKPLRSFSDEAVTEARCSIEYHSAEQAKEVERTDGRNKWIADLRESLAEESLTSPIARKEHRCDSCGRLIPVGMLMEKA